MTSQFYPFLRFFTVLFAWLLISCSSEEPKTEEEPEMNVEAELIFFNYKNDLEEDTFVWEYEVQFHNHSDFTVKGVPLVTYRYSNSEDFTITPGFTSENNPCPWRDLYPSFLSGRGSTVGNLWRAPGNNFCEG